MKKIMVFLLSLTIVFTPTLVFASNLGGWTINNKIAQGASLVLNASKTVLINGANIAKTSTAKITPVATNVAKILRGGAAGYALSIAVEQILGSVDWVLDPANNQIKYKPKEDLTKPPTSCQYYYLTKISNPSVVAYACSIQEVGNNTCKKRLENQNVDGCTISNVTETSFRMVTSCKVWDGTCYGFDSQIVPARKLNPAYDPNAQREEKTLSLDVVAQKVIDNAESSTNNDHKVGAQTATVGAAEDMLANDASTQNNVREQLETNARTQTSEEAQAETKPKDSTAPEAGSDIAIKFPVFCGWAPTVCEAAQKVITFPNTLVSWWTTATLAISTAYIETMDWFKKEPETNTEQLDIETPTPFDNSIFTKDRFQVSRQCPAPQTHSMTITGQTVSFSFDLTPLCNVLEMARPALIACSYLYAAYIVIGASRNG